MNTLELADLFLADEIAQIPPYVMKSENQEDIRARLRESVLSILILRKKQNLLMMLGRCFQCPEQIQKIFFID
jgi:hypothetical protein